MPPFPVSDTVYPNGQMQFGTNGMSIRAYMSTAAMHGLLAFAGEAVLDSQLDTDAFPQSYAARAVKYADALIAELNNKPEA